jgi:hypothetical protein
MRRRPGSPLSASVTLLVLLTGGAGACSGDKPLPPPPTSLEEEEAEETRPKIICPPDLETVMCAGNWAAICTGELMPEEIINCSEEGKACVVELGCRKCVPGEYSCGKNNNVLRCRADGGGRTEVEQCDESSGEHCSRTLHACENLCEVAEATRSYIGCEYWAVPTINSQLGVAPTASNPHAPFVFTVAVANPQAAKARITIERGDTVVKERKVAAGEVESVKLDWIAELAGEPLEEQSSVKVPDGAYRITSSIPVTVYQFNPSEFQGEVDGESVFSHTNDASLLLPTHTLTGNYFVVSRPTMFNERTPTGSDCGGAGEIPCPEAVVSSTPGFVAIVGVEEKPTRVEVTVSSHTNAGARGSVPALAPGDTHEFTLDRGEVLQLVSSTPSVCPADSFQTEMLETGCVEDPESGEDVCGDITIAFRYCDVSTDFDLTGTEIRSTGRVGVVAGHDCDFVPHDRWACDHLEETMFPVQAWGKEIYVAVSRPLRSEPNLVRILSAADGNELRFTPKVHESVTLDRGEFIEFASSEHFRVTGTRAIAAAQFLVGQDFDGVGSSGPYGAGDPGMSLGIPLEQWRNEYAFLVPSTFEKNYVNVIANRDQSIFLDDELITDFASVKGTDMSVARVPVEGGQHTIETTRPFGIVVYGYAVYTSYIYPGGLDLREINIL